MKNTILLFLFCLVACVGSAQENTTLYNHAIYGDLGFIAGVSGSLNS